jgi:hypothetical protein
VEREQARLLRLARRLIWDAEEARALVQSALANEPLEWKLAA